jgi:hypothetical protein
VQVVVPRPHEEKVAGLGTEEAPEEGVDGPGEGVAGLFVFEWKGDGGFDEATCKCQWGAGRFNSTALFLPSSDAFSQSVTRSRTRCVSPC